MESSTFRYEIKALTSELGIDLAIIAALYSEYFIEMKENIQQGRILCREENWIKLERIIHNMKGISSSLAVMDVYEATLKLDTRLKSEMPEGASEHIEYIFELFTAAEHDISSFFQENDIIV